MLPAIRLLLIACLLVFSAAGCGGGEPGLGGDLLDASDVASFGQLAAGLGGQVGLTVGRVGEPARQQLGDLTTGKAWSTIKLAIAAEILADARGPRGLSRPDAEDIRRAITASDNSAAAALFEELERRHGGLEGAATAVGDPLRKAGDTATNISTQGRDGFSPYGQTEWSLARQHRFVSRLAAGCVPDRASAGYLLRLMSEVVPGQRWGLGSAGVPAKFKGGWGPGEGGGYLVRQVGVLEFDGGSHPVVVTVAALPSDGRFASGQRMLTEVADWVDGHVDPAKAEPVGC